MSVFQKYPPKPPSVHASTKFTRFTELNSANGFAVTSSGAFTEVETIRRRGYRTITAKNASPRYLAEEPTRRCIIFGAPSDGRKLPPTLATERSSASREQSRIPPGFARRLS